MLRIRLQRIGRRNDPSFRVVVAEHTCGPKSGKFVERVGSRNPKTKETNLNAERIKYWLSVGAKASDTVHNLLVSAGIVEGKKVNALPKKTPIVKEVEENEEVKEEVKEDNSEKEEAKEDSSEEEKTEDDK